jgi:hypothetical protein
LNDAGSGALTGVRDDQIKSDVTRTAHDILAYLAEHPEAEDGLEGIVEWWLLEQTIRHQTVLVRTALSHLVRKRLVIEKKTETRSFVYHVNPDRVQEVKKLVKQPFDNGGEKETKPGNPQTPGPE